MGPNLPMEVGPLRKKTISYSTKSFQHTALGKLLEVLNPFLHVILPHIYMNLKIFLKSYPILERRNVILLLLLCFFFSNVKDFSFPKLLLNTKLYKLSFWAKL